ncbi:MaoC family dehydratase [Parahaliea mediterranea]|uniref:MaoC family dehydratase n=1 Tax=Parahaliea mediterranea TaxID=651086 RepID=A0A939DEF5_9GAMM|nr:MaoC family dehydratase [Parahaliea mediterranea]MBN7796686.1 MaoC family dehydratase [Parahaliea mediterranea]
MPEQGNFTFDELQVGQTASYTRTIEQRHIQLFAAATGDVNPVHLDPDYAASTPFGEPIAHGMLTGGLISAALALEMPGPGTVFLGQSLRFRAPVKPGDTVTIELTVTEKRSRRQWVSIDCRAVNQHGKVVASGSAEVMAPGEKLSVALPPEPAASIAP